MAEQNQEAQMKKNQPFSEDERPEHMQVRSEVTAHGVLNVKIKHGGSRQSYVSCLPPGAGACSLTKLFSIPAFVAPVSIATVPEIYNKKNKKLPLS